MYNKIPLPCTQVSCIVACHSYEMNEWMGWWYDIVVIIELMNDMGSISCITI